MKRTSWGVGLAVLIACGLPGTSAQAIVQSKCVAGKNKCLSKKAGSLLKCEQKAETLNNKPIEPDLTDCRNKAMGKFDGGGVTSKSCFGKLEEKTPNDCVTFDDTLPAELLADGCVARIVDAIDPGTIDKSKCGVGKKKCASKKLKSLLKCYEKQQKPGKPVDATELDACLATAMAKFDGGSDPAKGCFAKLEAKSGNDCLTPTGNSAAVESVIDSCASAFVAFIESTGTTTTTTAAPTTSTTTSTTSTTAAPTTTTTTSSPTPSTTGNGLVDASANLPGPGAVSLPGTFIVN